MANRGGLAFPWLSHAGSDLFASGAACEKAMSFDLWRAFIPVQKLALERQSSTLPDPLYLFHCGLNWHRLRDRSSGWELLGAMRSTDRGVRALAAELLAETESGRLLVRDLRRTRSGLKQIARDRPVSDTDQASKGGR
jgi:hypothetical protein